MNHQDIGQSEAARLLLWRVKWQDNGVDNGEDTYFNKGDAETRKRQLDDDPGAEGVYLAAVSVYDLKYESSARHVDLLWFDEQNEKLKRENRRLRNSGHVDALEPKDPEACACGFEANRDVMARHDRWCPKA